jgi:hypothetical protein
LLHAGGRLAGVEDTKATGWMEQLDDLIEVLALPDSVSIPQESFNLGSVCHCYLPLSLALAKVVSCSLSAATERGNSHMPATSLGDLGAPMLRRIS